MAEFGLKNILRPGFVGRTFKSGYRFQRHWDTPMATAFFFGETGAGLFLISMLLDFLPGILLGLLITGVGKTFFHLTHMGVPSKSWRAILRPDRSWVSRGLWGIVFFVGFGVVHVMGKLFGVVPEAFGPAIFWLAMAGAMMVLVYQGFAMSHSTAISFWNTGLMPVSSMLYGLLAGSSLVMLLEAIGFNVAEPDKLAMVAMSQKILLITVLLTLFSLLHSSKHGAKGAHQSYLLLTKDFLSQPFLFGVIGVGIVVPLAILLMAPMNFSTMLIATGAMLVGFYLYRILVFKAGVLDPIISPSDIFKR